MKTERIIKGLTYLAAALFILAFLYTAVMRINYPFELEWMEGGQLEHVVRILNGQEIYVAPSLEFIPYIYTPLYTYISAGIAEITGVSFFPLRLVSYISVLLTLILLYKIVKDKTKESYWAIIAAGLYAAMYKVGGFWFDIARVDSLFILFFFASIYYLLKNEKPLYAILAGLFAALSFLTKQSVVFMLFPIVLYLFIYERRKALWYFSTLMIVSVAVSLYFNIKTDGWYWFWNFSLPVTHHWNLKYFYSFWTIDLIKHFAIALSMVAVVFIKMDSKKLSKRELFYLYFLIGCLLDAWLLRMHYGGYLNVLFPALLAIAMLAPIGFAKLQTIFSNKKNAQKIIYLMVLLQFLVLLYNPGKEIPTRQDEKTGKEFITKLKNIKGDVFVPCHSYIPRLAGKKSYAHAVVIHDLFISKSHWKTKVWNELDSALSHHRFSAVIMNPEWHLPELDKYYHRAGTIFDKNVQSFFTVIGKTRPNDIWLPNK